MCHNGSLNGAINATCVIFYPPDFDQLPSMLIFIIF